MSPTTYNKQGLEIVGGGHVAICAFPFASHPQALVNLAVKLANAAPDTAFSFLTTHTSKLSLLLAAASSSPTNLVLYAVPDGLPEDDAVSAAADDDQTTHYHMHCFNMAMPGNFKQGIDAAVKANSNKKMISYIIADAFCARGVAIMAKEMQLPWAALWVLAPFALDPFFQMEHMYQLYLQAQAQAQADDGDIIIPGFSPLRFTDLPEHSLEPSGGGWTFFLPMMRALPEASAVLMNACREICQYTLVNDDGEGPKLIRKLLFVGCLTLPLIMSPPLVAGEEVDEEEDDDDDDTMIFPWLSRQRAGSVAYVSLGTISALGDEELGGLAEALEARGCPFLWSLKESMMEKLPRGFVERTREYGKVVPWVKQAEVLRHGAIGVQVTHSGYNSVLESILGGVPLICRSVWADNHIVRRWVEEVWGIGVGVEGGVFTKDGVLACLAAVFGEEKGKEMRANVAALRDKMLAAHRPNATAAKDLEALLEMIHDARTPR